MAVKTEEVLILQPETVAHHEVASLHRDMSDLEFEALKMDIQLNGQLVPIITYKEKLVDGRHRQRALIELGIHDMKCIALPGNMSIKDVRSRVFGTEVRRSDNVAQKAIRACNWMLSDGSITQEEAGTRVGVDRADVGRAKKLLDEHGRKAYDRMFKNGSLVVGGKTHSTLRNVLKALNSTMEEQKDKDPLTDGAKELFELLKTVKERGDKVAIAQAEVRAKNILKNWDM